MKRKAFETAVPHCVETPIFVQKLDFDKIFMHSIHLDTFEYRWIHSDTFGGKNSYFDSQIEKMDFWRKLKFRNSLQVFTKEKCQMYWMSN